MRISDDPMCMVCYSENVTVEGVIQTRSGPAGLALCGECETLLRQGNREAIFARLDTADRNLPVPRMAEEIYRLAINYFLDQVRPWLLDKEENNANPDRGS